MQAALSMCSLPALSMCSLPRLYSEMTLIASFAFEEQLVLQSRTPCSWRIHPAGSGAEEEAIRTTPFVGYRIPV